MPEEITAFRKAFDDLLTKAGVEQLVVLIDDLDRCLLDTAIETLEAVRLSVFTSRTAFIVAADASPWRRKPASSLCAALSRRLPHG